MFGLFKKRSQPQFAEIRELLFGDVPLQDWKPRAGEPDAAEPWASFAACRVALDAGDAPNAIALLRRVAETQEQDTRQYLQAWHFLRQLGIQPGPDEAKRVRGVVLEVHFREGLDTLAAYSDHTARYLNHGGRLVVSETSQEGVTELIEDLLRAGQRVADIIGPWKEPRRPAPREGYVRINMLTASGLHFGEAPFAALRDDPMGGPVIVAGTRLMTALIERTDGATVQIAAVDRR